MALEAPLIVTSPWVDLDLKAEVEEQTLPLTVEHLPRLHRLVGLSVVAWVPSVPLLSERPLLSSSLWGVDPTLADETVLEENFRPSASVAHSNP